MREISTPLGSGNRDFPMLDKRRRYADLVYLDSATTTLKPASVIDAEVGYLARMSANVHRGVSSLTQEVSEEYESARIAVSDFVDCDPRAVVFTKNATEGVNVVARGAGLEPSDRVLVPSSEHHSNIAPWVRAATVVPFPHDPLLPLDIERLESMVEEMRPTLVALSAASNLTGVLNPVREVCAMAKAHGVRTLVDGTQLVPHAELSIRSLGCDFFVFSAHKMLGPPGVGVLTGSFESMDELDPLILGGGAVSHIDESGCVLRELPHRLEAGTPNIGGVLGLKAAIEYLSRVGMNRVRSHCDELGREIERRLESIGSVSLLRVVGEKVPIVSFSMSDGHVSADALAEFLSNEHNIMIRSGDLCAQIRSSAERASRGLARISPYLYNDLADVEALETALKGLLGRLSGERLAQAG